MDLYYRLQTPAAVKTSIASADWLQFQLEVCLPPQYTKLSYYAVCVDTTCAISSRICKDGPDCFEHNMVAWDKSASALNSITVKISDSAPLFFSVAGWGRYNGMNSFSVSFRPE